MFSRKKKDEAPLVRAEKAASEEPIEAYEQANEDIRYCLSTLDRQIEEKRGVAKMARRVGQVVRDVDLSFRLPKKA